MPGVQNLVKYVDEFHSTNAMHIKRGFYLQEATDFCLKFDCLLQQMDGGENGVCSGSETTCGISIEEVALEKLKRGFTLNPDEVRTSTPGLTTHFRLGNGAFSNPRLSRNWLDYCMS